MKFKPTAAQWKIIKEVAFLGSEEPLPTVSHVQLECRESYNIGDANKLPHINMALVTYDFENGCNDLDLHDRGTHFTEQFRKGVDLDDLGRGMFDFYIYNRFDRDSDLRGNVLIRVIDGKMESVWIEGGHPASWSPETGITRTDGKRRYG